jgi:heme exporter protein D
MNWQSWGDFFAMGGYALYVWGSMGAVGVCLAVEVAGLKMRARSIREQIAVAAAAGMGEHA